MKKVQIPTVVLYYKNLDFEFKWMFPGSMKRLLFVSLISIMFFYFQGCKEGGGAKEQIQDNLPIRIQLLREGDAVLISLETEPGFGIQIEAPNRIEVEPTGGVEILSSDLGFQGSPNLEKPEYYQSLRPMNLTVKGRGNLWIHGKVFYCDFNKNICLPGKISRLLDLN